MNAVQAGECCAALCRTCVTTKAVPPAKGWKKAQLVPPRTLSRSPCQASSCRMPNFSPAPTPPAAPAAAELLGWRRCRPLGWARPCPAEGGAPGTLADLGLGPALPTTPSALPAAPMPAPDPRPSPGSASGVTGQAMSQLAPAPSTP